MSMYEQLKEILDEFAATDVASASGFRFMLTIRKEISRILVDDFEWDDLEANAVACGSSARMDVQLPNDLTDEQILELATPMAIVFSKMADGMMIAGYCLDDIVVIGGQLNLELKE